MVACGFEGVLPRERGDESIRPCHAKGMGGPEASSGHCDVDVLAGFVYPGSWGGDGNSNGVARKSFNGGGAGSSADTSVFKCDKS